MRREFASSQGKLMQAMAKYLCYFRMTKWESVCIVSAYMASPGRIDENF